MARAEDKTVLVVDDEPNVREYLTVVLRDAGFNVLTACDGEEALDLIRDRRPDFISLDLLMPRSSGHRLLYELKKDRALSRIPVLIVTAHARDELGRGDLEDLFKNRIMSGPGTYLEKPVNPVEYVRCIQRALGIEETPEAADRINLKEELQKSIQEASPDALSRALKVLQDEEDR
jgi:CheY-like chemotaxis protein